MSNIDFSLWCDFIQRDFLENEFSKLVDSKLINGATSNPSIFAQALKNPIYQSAIATLKGKNSKEIYEHLALADIRRAAQILKPLWESNPAQGFISLEIDPLLCDDVAQSVDEGVRLYQSIALPNVMIKVPATLAGYEIMNALASKGININATLVFAPSQAKECVLALQNGFKKAQDSHTEYSNLLQGVISVFVSRFDRMLDDSLPTNLRLQTGIINAMDCYEIIEQYNAPHIRTLFASTGVKNENVPKSYYIDKLILPHSVNTAPLESIRAYEMSEDKGQKSLINTSSRLAFWENLKEKNIHRDIIAHHLLDEGIVAFKQSFESLLTSL
ncbi:transaldolase [Helicobacter sp. MIT 21-1697]|uniref:transaldolase n=1 Tax=Helicobacter sp. MIT 21-1697 TaxID=2993733 RepID=UPI00224A79BA|nr:transaldolase [Helicobacter sp. MIT 21-1697]MCX2717034.1 transaldolase [Helicobacter sp. MIT 21-1697]